MNGPTDHPIILFDGVCGLCNAFVTFLISHDPKAIFRFAPLQSSIGAKLLSENGIPADSLNSVVVVLEGKAFLRSEAVLKGVRRLGGIWSLSSIFLIVPECIRDWVYDYVARNRYKWFGKYESCPLPTPEIRSRFLGD